MKKNVLVIGGCGYIGSELIPYLQKQSNIGSVRSIDLEWFGNPGRISNDKSDFKTLDDQIIGLFDTIILLAGHSSVKMCQNNLNSAFQNNVVNFINLIQKVHSRQQFIYASSSSIYGGVNKNLVDEKCEEYSANNYYDMSKYDIDAYMKMFGKIQYYGLRFGTVNGPSPNFRNDVMINAMFSSAKRDGVISVFNPQIRRPILALSDLCRAIHAIISRGGQSHAGIYNLASFNSSVEMIGSKVASYLTVPLRIDGNTPNVYDFTISSKKFEETFNFKFKETTESILEDIENNVTRMTMANRNNPVQYA